MEEKGWKEKFKLPTENLHKFQNFFYCLAKAEDTFKFPQFPPLTNGDNWEYPIGSRHKRHTRRERIVRPAL
jgi:hypothetical protein